MSNPSQLAGARPLFRLFRIFVVCLDVFVPRFVTREIPCRAILKTDVSSDGHPAILKASYFNLFGWPVFVRAKVYLR